MYCVFLTDHSMKAREAEMLPSLILERLLNSDFPLGKSEQPRQPCVNNLRCECECKQ